MFSTLRNSKALTHHTKMEFVAETIADLSPSLTLSITSQAKEMQEEGKPPPGLDPDTHNVRSAAFLLPRDQAYAEAARERLRAKPGTPHASV